MLTTVEKIIFVVLALVSAGFTIQGCKTIVDSIRKGRPAPELKNVPLGPGETAALLAGYGRDDATLRARIEALGWIFDCLWYGWNGVAALAGLPIDPGLQARLVARLTA